MHEQTRETKEPSALSLCIIFVVAVVSLLVFLTIEGMDLLQDHTLIITAEVLITLFVALLSLPNNGNGLTRLLS